MYKANLLKEILLVLSDENKTEKDIKWVGIGENIWATWEEFKPIAEKINYTYKQFGNYDIKINAELIIVGDDWWMERLALDGEEWFEFKTQPQKPLKHAKITEDMVKSQYIDFDKIKNKK